MKSVGYADAPRFQEVVVSYDILSIIPLYSPDPVTEALVQ